MEEGHACAEKGRGERHAQLFSSEWPKVLRLTGLGRWVKRRKNPKTGDEEEGSFGTFASWREYVSSCSFIARIMWK